MCWGSRGARLQMRSRKPFAKKAKELHPDRNADNPNAETQFKEANEAYDVLKDADKKAPRSTAQNPAAMPPKAANHAPLSPGQNLQANPPGAALATSPQVGQSHLANPAANQRRARVRNPRQGQSTPMPATLRNALSRPKAATPRPGANPNPGAHDLRPPLGQQFAGVQHPVWI